MHMNEVSKKIIFYLCLGLIIVQSLACIRLHDRLTDKSIEGYQADEGVVKFGYVAAVVTMTMAFMTVVMLVAAGAQNCVNIEHLAEFLLPGLLIVISSFSLAFYVKVKSNEGDAANDQEVKGELAVSIINIILAGIFLILQIIHRGEQAGYYSTGKFGEMTGVIAHSRQELVPQAPQAPQAPQVPTRPQVPVRPTQRPQMPASRPQMPASSSIGKPPGFKGGFNSALNEIYKVYPGLK